MVSCVCVRDVSKHDTQTRHAATRTPSHECCACIQTHKHAHPCTGGKGKVDASERFSFESSPQEKQAVCGKFHCKDQGTGVDNEAAQYIIASTSEKAVGTKYALNIHLLKFFALYQWNLPRPDIIFSVTGGAAAFDLNNDEKDKILKGLMEGTRELSPWFITGGSNVGIMKYVGEARAKYNPSVPLIGIGPLGIFKDIDELKRLARGHGSAMTRKKTLVLKDDQPWKLTTEESSGQVMKNTDRQRQKQPGVELNNNHSHFILVDDGAQAGFGTETKLRANFESCVAANLPPHNIRDETGKVKGAIRPFQSGCKSREMETYILETMKKEEISWNRMSLKNPGPKTSFGGVPLVSVCVQGGPGTIQTVADATANFTPSLLVRGSGKAADLMSDCVLMRFGPQHDHYTQPLDRDRKQRLLMSFFASECGLLTEDVTSVGGGSDVVHDWSSDDYQCYNLAGVKAVLMRAAQCLQDEANIAHMKEACQQDGTLRRVEEWVNKYCERVSSEPRNFYGQTKREVQDFSGLQKGQFGAVTAFCDRQGLFCNIEPLDTSPNTVNILIHSRTEKFDLHKGGGKSFMSEAKAAANDIRPLANRKWSKEDIDRSHHLEDKCRHIFHEYEMVLNEQDYSKKPGEYCRLLNLTLKAVTSNMCWVYELHSLLPNAPDFRSSLLACLINGLGHPASDDETTLSRKLSYTILWDRVDVLDEVLQRTGLKEPKKRLAVLQHAIIEAIGRNRVEVTAKLLDSGANLDKFDIGVKHHKEEKRKILKLVRKASSVLREDKQKVDTQDADGPLNTEEFEELKHFESWERLLNLGKRDSHSSYVNVLSSEVKDTLNSNSSMFSNMNDPFEFLRSRLRKYQGSSVSPQSDTQSDEEEAPSREPMLMHDQLRLYTILSAKTMEVKRGMEIKQSLKRNDRGSAGPKPAVAALEEAKVTRHLMILLGLYQDILGERFRYKLGVQGPFFDLFLWNVLMNRKEMAELFWRHCIFPVRSAITAACLLRKMSAKIVVDPITSKSMLDNADYFEDLAIQVQKKALEQDQATATQSMDCPLIVWSNFSLLDLAMYAGCERFVEECCESAIDDLFTGDISPYGTEWLEVKIFACICTLGTALYFRPHMLQFNAPPRSSVVRNAAQRRKAPEGYPWKPLEHGTLRELYARYQKQKENKIGSAQSPRAAESSTCGDDETSGDDVAHLFQQALDMRSKLMSNQGTIVYRKAMRLVHKVDTDPSWAKNMSDEQLRELWEPTFTFRERLYLFWHAPMVLYFSNMIVQMIVTAFFINLHCHLNNMISTPELRRLTVMHEIVLSLYFISCFVRESLQLFISTTSSEYFQDKWNWFDIISMITFFAGTCVHLRSCLCHCASRSKWH